MLRNLIENITLTPQEKVVMEYIEQNPDCVLNNNATELAKLIFVSPPTIIRLVRKLGFQRYVDFQIAYSKEYTLSQKMESVVIDEESSLNDIMTILPEIYQHVYLETKNLTNKEAFVRVINYVLQAKQIDFYANDNNYSEAQSACLKLNSLGFRAQAFNAVNEHYIDILNPKETVCFVLSHTGKNKSMIETAYYLRKKHFRVVAITGFVNSALELICNESLFIDLNLHDLPREMLLYGTAIHYLLDILVVSVALKKRNVKK